MGIYDRDYYRDDEQRGFSINRLFRGRSVVTTLIILNVAVFILDGLFAQPSMSRQAPPGPVSQFLSLSESDLAQPWYWFRFLTYGFAHANAQHILFNMIGLFFFGRAIEGLLGSRTFFWMYITALLAGSLAWSLGAVVSPKPVLGVLGASGGVVATVLLFCFHYPHQRVLLMMVIPIPAWVLGVLLVGSDLYGAMTRPALSEANQIAFGVHLAGAAYAYLFFKTRWELSQLLPGGLGGMSKLFKPRPQLRVHRPESESDAALARKADEVLKKLYEQGEASLTASERKVLEDYSRRVKQQR